MFTSYGTIAYMNMYFLSSSFLYKLAINVSVTYQEYIQYLVDYTYNRLIDCFNALIYSKMCSETLFIILFVKILYTSAASNRFAYL